MPSARSNSTSLRCAVIGAGGYSGAELVSILIDHPAAELVGLFASERRAEGGDVPSIGALVPRLRGRCDLPLLPTSVQEILALGPDAVFLATPHAVSHDLVPALRRPGTVVLDLSGAFRLKNAALYPRHYGFEHRHPALLASAVYGLAEHNREAIRAADLIAVPGCYPTSAILPLAPLVRAGAIDLSRRPIVDSTSGVSGAGRRPALASHFCEVSLQPYNVMTHRHNPEIDAYCGAPVVFAPHLGAFDRGILSTIHAELAPGWNAERIGRTLASAYSHEPFIRLLPPGEWPSIASVRATNFCDMAWAVDEAGSHLVIVSAIDNLVKGAAGQAVQCMNIRFGLPETAGLLSAAWQMELA